jgi:hypothetical protein
MVLQRGPAVSRLTMQETEYQGHVIRFDAIQTLTTRYWEGRAYIHYRENERLRVVSRYGPYNTFTTKVQAENYMLEDAKRSVDTRVESQRDDAVETEERSPEHTACMEEGLQVT